jgi:hypothetical protein
MTEDTGLIDLQKRQYKHDKEHHPDIYNTSYPARMNHYVLHFSKYVGRLSKTHSDEKKLEKKLEKTLADSIIVTLAAANTLNLDLNDEMRERFEVDSNGVNNIAEKLNQSSEVSEMDEVREWLFNRMATPAGQLSDAMESLDHMESMDTRQILENGTVEILADLLIASDKLDANINELLDDRWTEIEEESIL